MTNQGLCKGFYRCLALAAAVLAVHNPVAGFDLDGKAKL